MERIFNKEIKKYNKLVSKLLNKNILDLIPKPLILIVVDTETANTGEIIQIAYNIYEYYVKTSYYKCISKYDIIINENINKVEYYKKYTLRHIKKYGKDPKDVFTLFSNHIKKCNYLIGHNIIFDTGKIIKYFKKYSIEYIMPKQLCTMKLSRDHVGLLNIKGWAKYPKLSELYFFYYKKEPDKTKTHTAEYDIYLTFLCFIGMCKDNLIKFV
jgi:hypothetical protein